MKTHNFWRKSLCKNRYLHRFEIKEEYTDGVKEVCKICGKSKFFRLIEGKLNNYEYMSYHIRQALPPQYETAVYHEYQFDPLAEVKIQSPYV